MTRSQQSAQEFIQGAFSPMVAVLTSEDAEMVCQKNGLSFVELIRPFSQLTNEAHIRDPVNPSLVIPIKNLKLNMMDLQVSPPPQPLIQRILNEVVTRTLTQVDISEVPGLKQQLEGMIPWYDAFKDCFFQLLKPMEHEFIRHILACSIVVSTHHLDPMSAFASLSTKQTNIQQTSDRSNPYVKWFSSNTFKYYVLVHDVSDGEDAKADAVFQSMKSVYGSHTCFLLQINSRPKLLPNTPDNVTMPDPWSQYLYPFGDETFDLDDESEDQISPSDKSKPASPAELEKTEEKIISELERAEQMAEASMSSPLRFQDPLTSMHYNETLDNDDDIDDLGPLKPNPPDIVKDIPEPVNKPVTSEKALRIMEYKKSLKQFSFYAVASQGNLSSGKQRGQCLTVTDHDRIKAFVYEFAVRGLLPHIEKLMRTISEQILSRKGIHRSIVNVTKKWFGSNKTAGGSLGAGLSSGVSYPSDSPELQQRKLGDLAFLVQHYELAFNSYHTAKRDFNNEHAWMYFAGALEMAAISAFMQGPQRSYPVHYFEACISTYLNTCRMPEYATRACLMSTEALKSRGMYADAAFEFIKLTNEDSDLRSALLLEQAAYCYLHNNPPMIRKYAFHMILAGHRYSKAVQRKHTLRCYAYALQIYKDKGWTLAEDHVNFIIGRQCFNIGQLKNAKQALQELLTCESQQHPVQQASHLREFLTVFKQNLEYQRKRTDLGHEVIPEIPLPKIDSNSVRVLLYCGESSLSRAQELAGSPFSADPSRTRTIIAGQYSFKRLYGKNYISRWSDLEKKTVEHIAGEVPYPWKPFIPCLSSAVNNSERPNCIVGESIAVEVVFYNPLRLPLNVLNLHLLWEFVPENADNASVISNKEEKKDDTVWTEFVDNIMLKSHEKKPVSLVLMPKKLGSLRVIGLVYTLSSVSVTGSVDEDGKVELSQQSDYSLVAVGVYGQQKLEVRGPRLNGTKKEKTSVMYGIDKRLDLRVLHSMPLLEVSMTNFPISLLCGEIQQTNFNFRNKGGIPLRNLYVSCSKQECFSVKAASLSTSNVEHESGIYETISNCGIQFSEVDDASITRPNIVTKIPIPGGKLLPDSEFQMPVWIRGLESPGVHELDFLFYYEPMDKVAVMPYRVIHQTVRIQTLSTLTISANSRRCDVSITKDPTSTGTENQVENESYIVALNIENRAQGSTFPRCVEFSVDQVTCFAKEWKLKLISRLPSGAPKLKPGESLTLHFRTSLVRPERDSGHTVVSQLSFGNTLADGSKSPAMDFFVRTGSEKFSTQPHKSLRQRLGLIVFWQTSFIDDACVRHTIYGQNHTSIHRLGEDVIEQPWSNSVPSSGFRNGSDEWTASHVSENSSSLVDIYLSHPSRIHHDFKHERYCLVPIHVNLKNFDELEKKLMIQVKADSNESLTSTLNSGSPPIVELVSSSPDLTTEPSPTYAPCWVGKTKMTVVLRPHEQTSVDLKALISRPGLYDLNSVVFSLATAARDASFRPVKTVNLPSLVCIASA